MRYTLSYDERLKKKIKKLDNGTKVILKKWIEKNLMDCEEPRSKGNLCVELCQNIGDIELEIID